ncbi:hypothetical protein WMY93_003526 [Mugilogobius chulae]|uniref:Uncharacterized protein n=1 Tax=Mugilogobius chulae TaxID=88201 RepID=A0AAW0PYG4_9GOBI
MPRRKRTAGSSSDGTEDPEDSDFSAEEPAEVARRRSSTRLTRASLRLTRSSQDSRVRSSSPAAAEESPREAPLAASIFTSGRRITRSQLGAANTTAKKYPLRQSRSSGSDTEANEQKHGADRDESPPRTQQETPTHLSLT